MLRRLRPLLLPALSFVLAAAPASAQFVPYYGKNKIKYDNFSWRIYKSAHFEVYYYPEFEQHLARLTAYLESASNCTRDNRGTLSVSAASRIIIRSSGSQMPRK